MSKPGEVLNHCYWDLFHIYAAELLYMKQSPICRVKRTHRKHLTCISNKSNMEKTSSYLILVPREHMVKTQHLSTYPAVLRFALNCYLFFWGKVMLWVYCLCDFTQTTQTRRHPAARWITNHSRCSTHHLRQMHRQALAVQTHRN